MATKIQGSAAQDPQVGGLPEGSGPAGRGARRWAAPSVEPFVIDDVQPPIIINAPDEKTALVIAEQIGMVTGDMVDPAMSIQRVLPLLRAFCGDQFPRVWAMLPKENTTESVYVMLQALQDHFSEQMAVLAHAKEAAELPGGSQGLVGLDRPLRRGHRVRPAGRTAGVDLLDFFDPPAALASAVQLPGAAAPWGQYKSDLAMDEDWAEIDPGPAGGRRGGRPSGRPRSDHAAALHPRDRLPGVDRRPDPGRAQRGVRRAVGQERAAHPGAAPAEDGHGRRPRASGGPRAAAEVEQEIFGGGLEIQR
jgi:hypothetical protein